MRAVGNQEFLVVDNDMLARSLREIVDRSRPSQPPPPSIPRVHLPVSPDGVLVAGQLYPDASDTNIRWYLPTYRLNTNGGRYTTSLKWRSPTDPPDGPLAYLQVELAADPPATATDAAREIEHQAIARLAYRLPMVPMTPLSVPGAPASPQPQLEAEPEPRDEPEVQGDPDLLLELGPLAPGADGVRRCRLALTQKADFDRLYQIMTDARYGGQLQVHCLATVGRRTWRQIIPFPVDTPVSSHPVETTVPVMLPVKTTVPVTVPVGRPRRPFPDEDRPPISPVRINGGLRNVQEPRARVVEDGGAIGPAEISQDVVAAPPVADVVAPQLVSEPAVVASDTAVQALAAPAEQSLLFRLASSDVVADIDGVVTPALPSLAFVGVDGRPVLVRISVETVQTIDPFCFPVATNASMFDIPGDLTPTTNEILIPTPVTVDGEGSAIFYQDSLYPDRWSYRPQEFRLSRSGTNPYLPSLVFGFVDVVAPTPGAGGGGSSGMSGPGTGGVGTTVQYQVQMAYEAAPWISPLLFDEIRQQATAAAGSGTTGARLLPLVSASSRLSLRLAMDSASPPGTVVEVKRDGAHVTLDNGIIDAITLSPDEFKRVVAAMTGPGIDGTVDATVVGAPTAVGVPVNLSLRETVGPLFARSLRPAPDGSGWLVTLTNELESPVRITELFRTVVAPGVVATPGPPPAAPVAPGSSVTIAYQLDPPGAQVLDISPAMRTAVDVDPSQLLSRLMVNQGYAATTFTVPVTIDPVYFTAPASDGRTLSGVTVDFDAGVTVQLTAGNPSQSAVLRMRLLGWLLDQPDATNYQYRVTDHWATGAAGTPGAWQSGAGEAPLTVVPNPPG
jgi:hypothetical protein